MYYIQLKIQTIKRSSIDILRPKNHAHNTTQKIEPHIIQV